MYVGKNDAFRCQVPTICQKIIFRKKIQNFSTFKAILRNVNPED